MPAEPAELLVVRIARLQAAVRAHKLTIKTAREALHVAATELATIEAECRARGMAIEFVNPRGVGAIHGRPDPHA